MLFRSSSSNEATVVQQWPQPAQVLWTELQYGANLPSTTAVWCCPESVQSRGCHVTPYVTPQGFLALAALLLVLWLPPLFFSSGAPTYQVPVLQVRTAG